MATEAERRDEALAIVYRELITAELTLSLAADTLAQLGWTSATDQLRSELATVRDLIHDLAAYDYAPSYTEPTTGA